MEDEIIDIFIVLGCLTVGVFGGIVLILKSIATTSPSPKRMTIKIARPPSRVAPVQRPGHLAISRMKSAPIPEIVHSPCAGEANSCFSSDIESGLHRQAVFIMATAGKTYKSSSYRPMCFWSASDVDDWLRKRRPKLALKYSLFFLKHGISGRVLMEMTDGDLLEIGVNSLEERQDLLLEIRKEKLYSDMDELKQLT
ncbi:hypothetical protein PENTCL1PPCAC_21091, partial [Pristionchus entomophagus]